MFAENKLFATLDTTVRKVIIDNLPFCCRIRLGFIRKLPTDLVDSFKSTLDEVREADLFVHIVVIFPTPDFEEQIEVVNKTLADMVHPVKPMILVFNKIDAYTYVGKRRRPYPQKQGKLNTRRTDEDVDGKMEDNCLFHLPVNDQYRGTESVVYQRVKELHVQKYPYNDFLYQTYEEGEV